MAAAARQLLDDPINEVEELESDLVNFKAFVVEPSGTCTGTGTDPKFSAHGPKMRGRHRHASPKTLASAAPAPSTPFASHVTGSRTWL